MSNGPQEQSSGDSHEEPRLSDSEGSSDVAFGVMLTPAKNADTEESGIIAVPGLRVGDEVHLLMSRPNSGKGKSSVGAGNPNYDKNWDRVFGKKLENSENN